MPLHRQTKSAKIREHTKQENKPLLFGLDKCFLKKVKYKSNKTNYSGDTKQALNEISADYVTKPNPRERYIRKKGQSVSLSGLAF